MALRNSSLVQNQNHGINFNGASIGGNIDPAKVQKKGGGLGGRKPLGDLSNAQKPSLGKTFKKEGPKSLADDVNRKSGNVKASERVHWSITTRKALTDISNSEKPRGSETGNLKISKLKVLAEEPYHINSIAEEKFLHNHQECMKLQAGHKDTNYFMETLGLHKDVSKKAWASPPSSRLKMEDLLRSMQPEEMDELQLGAVGSPQKREHFKELDSPFPPSSPGSPYHSMLWKEDDISFMLAKTPKILKF